MEAERAAEAAAETPQSMAAPHDAVAGYRDSAPPRAQEHARISSMGAPDHQQHHPGPAYRPTEMETNVLTRIEQQVAFNYSMLQGHHQDIARISEVVGRLQYDFHSIVTVLEDLRGELRQRPAHTAPDPNRYDPGDVDVLATQIATVTTKVSAVDNLAVQVSLMKRRLQRMEGKEQSSSAGPTRPETDSSHHEGTPPESQHPQSVPNQSYPQARARPAVSPSQHGPPDYTLNLAPESQPPPNQYPPIERPPLATERHPHHVQQVPGFRPAEPQPPPPALSGWRPVEGFAPSGLPQPPPPGQPLRSNHLESEAQSSGWAAVNSSQGPKRSLDDRPPSMGDSYSGSPKRPKLAPLKPRSSYGDEPPLHGQLPFAQPGAGEHPFQPRSRMHSGDGQMPPNSHFAGPAPPLGANSYRFITSTGQPEHQEPWRTQDIKQENSADQHMIAGIEPIRGRGRGGRGGRGRGSRGGRGRGGMNAAPTAAAYGSPNQEHGHVAPEWRDMVYTGTHTSPNGQLIALHPFSPADAARGVPLELVSQPGAPPIAGPPGQDGDYPATPIGGSIDLDGPNSASKKSRSKPIRNSDGVLIRKDGRPDMRSVSSANNLRKVHAKKEAERAELEGRTPTSARSIAPANSSSLSGDEGDEHDDEHYDEEDGDRDESQRRRHSDSRGTSPHLGGEQQAKVEVHREMLNRMFAQPKTTAESWFPRPDAMDVDQRSKEEQGGERMVIEARWRGTGDVAMADAGPSTRQSEEKGGTSANTSELTPVSGEEAETAAVAEGDDGIRAATPQVDAGAEQAKAVEAQRPPHVNTHESPYPALDAETRA